MLINLLASAALLNSLGSADIAQALDSRRLPSHGAPNVIARVDADVNGDTLLDAIVLYHYTTTREGGRSAYFIVAIVSGASGYELTPSLRIGYRGYELWSELHLDGEAFRLVGTKWLSDDAMCCPSAQATAVLHFEDGALVQTRGSWERSVPRE